MKKEKEIWKDVIDSNSHYKVSNLGNIKSCERVIERSNGLKMLIQERILKKQLNKSTGYYTVHISYNKTIKQKKIHHLVAESFLQHKKTNGLVIDHIDNNKDNNKLSNLQIITIRENSSKDKKGFSSGYVGVCWVNKTKKWKAQIRYKGSKIFLGYFDCELMAAEAYNNKLQTIKNK